MKTLSVLALLLAIGAGPISADTGNCPAILKFASKPLQGGAPVDFCEAYRGKVILAVNTASQCGFTPQFKGLEALYREFKTKGLVVLGFPSNDFKQEFADPEKTAKLCFVNYGVTFPMFASSAVSGDGANAFFKELAQQSGVTPQWNFQKYLIDGAGKVVKVFPSNVAPEDIVLRATIESALSQLPAKP
ncbi:MAG: glutathione peroxidase [Methylococcaceae bacterium]|jgi:glutathione peroxidase|nr:glutathione peroxidase [Methylococcaceae bacterium]